MLTERVFESEKVSLNYAESPGPGDPLVLLHGISSRWQGFLPVIPGLIARWHVYALDLRGHGKSGRVPGGYRFVDYAEDVVPFLEEVVGQPAVLFGHSLGAMVAIATAAKAPNSVRAVVLEDPPVYAAEGKRTNPSFAHRFTKSRELVRRGSSMEEMMLRLRELMPGDDDAAQRYRAKSLLMLDAEVFSPAIEGHSRGDYDLEGFLRGIRCPVLLLQGNRELGGVMEDAEADNAASLIEDCTLVKIGETGHQIHTDCPERTLKTVSNFLESL